MAHLNDECFTSLVSPHFDGLYRLAYRLTQRRADSEDLCQDVLVKLFERRDELSSIRDLAPYLRRVLYNQFVDDKRRYGRQPLHLLDTGAVLENVQSEHGAESDAVQLEQRRHLEGALAKLSEEHRVVVVLADAEGYTLAEIESLTDVPLGTLKSRLHRAHARLRELLSGDGTNPVDSSCSSMEGAKRNAV